MCNSDRLIHEKQVFPTMVGNAAHSDMVTGTHYYCINACIKHAPLTLHLSYNSPHSTSTHLPQKRVAHHIYSNTMLEYIYIHTAVSVRVRK